MINDLKDSLDDIKALDTYLEENNILNSYLLDSITARTPEEIFTSISMSSDGIQLIGNSMDRWTIGEFGQNLKQVEEFKDIFISRITLEEGYYSFILNINLKDVSQYEDFEESEENKIGETTD